jgi:hypothetical protein
MSGTQFPPIGPTSLVQILKAFVYQEYSDDENIQAFNSSFNGIAQDYLDWFNSVNLPIYTGLSGALLDWVAQGVYGISRPSLPFGQVVSVGPVNTWGPNQIALNTSVTTGTVQDFTTTDDIFQRIITWHFFKGDGQQFSIPWLKRRVMRFLIGTAGTAPNIDNTYPVSVAFSSGDAVTITVTTGGAVVLATAQIFQAAVASGAVAMPFQFSFTVTLAS